MDLGDKLDKWFWAKVDQQIQNRERKIIEKLMNAKTSEEVEDIIVDNIDAFDNNPGLFKSAKDAKKRIKNVRREAMASWEIHELN